MESPLLSYIDVRHASFLPPQQTIGKARDLDPRYTITDSIALIRDALADFVSQSRRVHVPVEEQGVLAQAAEPAVAESVNSLGVGANQDEEMVTMQTMTIDRFLPDTCPTAQPQQPHGKDLTPPLPSAGHAKKKQHLADQSPKVPSNAPMRTPYRASGGIVIQELAGDSRPIAQVRTNVASFS